MKNLLDNCVFKFIFKAVKIFYLFILVMYLLFLIIVGLSNNMSIIGYRLFTIKASSMAGVYDLDDVIMTKKVDSNKLKVGNDIVYEGECGGLNGVKVTNRIVKIDKDKKGEKAFITKGVNSNVDDPSISSKQIIGKVTLKVPIITQINHIFKDGMSFFLFIFCPLVLIIILEIVKTILDIKLENKQKSNFCSEPVIIATMDVNEEEKEEGKKGNKTDSKSIDKEKIKEKDSKKAQNNVKIKRNAKSKLKKKENLKSKDNESLEVPQIIKNEKVDDTEEKTKNEKKDNSSDVIKEIDII